MVLAYISITMTQTNSDENKARSEETILKTVKQQYRNSSCKSAFDPEKACSFLTVSLKARA